MTKKEAIRINQLVASHGHAARGHVRSEFKVSDAEADRLIAQARAKAARRVDPDAKGVPQ